MGLFIRERRGPAWKQSWTQQTLASMSLPPQPLCVITGITLTLVSLLAYVKYRSWTQRYSIMLNFCYLLVPLLLLFAVLLQGKLPCFVVGGNRRRNTAILGKFKGINWPLLLLAMVNLVMLFYQSKFHSWWGSNLWG
ncbi:hypothetical protein CFOL_v3_07140 [Cephalotus follicularis]|uniref:Uncharacterized protein n=1 Tax=Cephalotus follicularis TaxID=3775 RepID=A0A1Q3B748_CEPFO|nr:hypothetical protein CFOL_v3_07140 [Cephalotus follicularis]